MGTHLGVEAIATLVAALCGGVIQTTPYIGHPAYKAMGGRAALSGFGGPFRDVLFCPTGGIREDTLAAYLELPNVLCAGGSWMAPDEDIAKGAWSAIAERARRVSRPRQ